VAAVYDGSAYFVYINGALDNRGNEPSNYGASQGPYTKIGEADLGEPFNRFSGLIDEVEVFNRALSASEIQAIYNAGTAGKCKGLSLLPPSLTFPPRDVGTTSPEKVVTATNATPNPVTTLSIEATGDFASPTNTCQSPIAPDARCTISVTFTPTQFGKRTGSLIVTDDAPGSPQTVTLTGTGLGPGAKLTPKTLNFGTHLVGTGSPPQTVTLTNTGNQTLNIAGIAPTGPFSMQSNTCGSTFAAKASCTIAVVLDPTTKGAQTGMPSVTDNAPGSPQVVNLKGTGTVVELAPTGLSFGDRTVNTTSASQSVTLTNTGATALSVTIAARGDFAQSNDCETRVHGGASCTINVTLLPPPQGTAVGQYQ